MKKLTYIPTAKTSLILFLFISLILPMSVGAASLYFEPDTVNVAAGEEFEINLIIETGKEGVSALQTELLFDPKSVEVRSLSKKGSDFSLWTIEPEFSNTSGSIKLGGGINNSGDDIKTGEFKFITIKFKAVADKSILKVVDHIAYSGDGFGTLLNPKTKVANFIVSTPPIETILEPKIPSNTSVAPQVSTPATPEVISTPSVPLEKEITIESTPDEKTPVLVDNEIISTS